MIDLDGIFDMIEIERLIALCEDLSGAESQRLRRMLKKGIVKFKYRKKSDDSVRTARGTLRPDMLPRYRVKRRAKYNPKRFIYWDVEKNSFRSFLRANFLEITGMEKEKPTEDDAAEV